MSYCDDDVIIECNDNKKMSIKDQKEFLQKSNEEATKIREIINEKFIDYSLQEKKLIGN